MRHLEHLDTARSAALMPGEPCVLAGQSGTCKACEVEQAIERHRNRRMALTNSVQAGDIRGEVSGRLGGARRLA